MSRIRNQAECDSAANVHRYEMMKERAALEEQGAVLLCSDCDELAAPRSCYCEKCEAAIYGEEGR